MTKEEKVDRARKAQEISLARKIMDVLSQKADAISQDGVSQERFRLEAAERKQLLEINNLGIVEAVGAGLVSLFVLRRVRTTLLRRLWANSSRQSQQSSDTTMSHHVHHNPPPPSRPPAGPSSTTGSFAQNNSPFRQQGAPQFPSMPPPPLSHPASQLSPPKGIGSAPMPKQGTFAFLFGWFLDGLGAFSVMVTVSLLLTDVNKILSKLATLPLVEGRSTVAREFCPEVVRAMRRLRAESDEAAQILDDAKTKQLQGVIQFAENCQRRAAYEANLRAEKGVGKHYPVSVPPPGVPPDFPLQPSDNSDLFAEEETNGTRSGGGETDLGDFYDPRRDTWPDDLTTDREDQGKR